jgi:predicted methyltransferase
MGYVRQSTVIGLAEAAGFVLEETSEINANPADPADHPVWYLRPTRASPRPGSPDAEGFDRAAYDAIGESDRMTLRFRKPE